ncbi:hypothetical protein C8R45DRAFT_207647 [Mycena sanguinolenta]|nr:hypothetical protein C8R45DRAFT_207647 [Mycena sanguinolenta]
MKDRSATPLALIDCHQNLTCTGFESTLASSFHVFCAQNFRLRARFTMPLVQIEVCDFKSYHQQTLGLFKNSTSVISPESSGRDISYLLCSGPRVPSFAVHDSRILSTAAGRVELKNISSVFPNFKLKSKVVIDKCATPP